MSERWRQPVIPLTVDQSDHEGVVLPDGRVFRQPVLGLKEDDKERIRLGYVCMNCLEPQERPFPERCGVCKYPMRRLQAPAFAREFAPEPVVVGPTTTLEEERAGIAERAAKEREANGGS